MRPLIILLLVLLMTWSNKANACHLNDIERDEFFAVMVGVPVALTSSFLFASIGFAIDIREDRPYYWRVAGYSAFASTAGVGITFARYDEDVYEDDFSEFIRYPLLFGAIATVLAHILLIRSTDKTSSALWQYAPQVSVSPLVRVGSLRLNWSL